MITLEIPVQVDRDQEKAKTRKNCERAFLNEMLEVSGGIRRLADGMLDADYTQMCRLRESVQLLADQIVEEIRVYRAFLDEEPQGVGGSAVEVDGRECLARVRDQFRNHPLLEERRIVIAPGLANLPVRTDPAVVGMILAHLTRDALQLSAPGSTILLDAGRKPGAVWFSVQFPGPQQPQAEQTAGAGGPESPDPTSGRTGIRLLAEQFLRGEVAFAGDPALGSTWTVTLPVAGS